MRVAAAAGSPYLSAMSRIGLAVFLAVVVLALPAPVLAQQPRADEAVPLYTNADLEKFGPRTAPAGPVRFPDAGEWRFVQEFLDRQYSRVDADRRHDLDRAVVDEYTAPPEPRYRLLSPYYGYYGYHGYNAYAEYNGYPGYPRTYPYGVPAQDRRLHGAGHGHGAGDYRDVANRAGGRNPSHGQPPRHGAPPARGGHPQHSAR
jgi:hypothetical protein